MLRSTLFIACCAALCGCASADSISTPTDYLPLVPTVPPPALDFSTIVTKDVQSAPFERAATVDGLNGPPFAPRQQLVCGGGLDRHGRLAPKHRVQVRILGARTEWIPIDGAITRKIYLHLY